VEPSRAAKHWPYTLLALIAFAAVLYFFGLGRLALLGPDEPRYAEVAREMFASNDYVSPRLGGCLWFEKPALLYWLSATSYHLFGVNEFAARVPSALAAIGMAAFLVFALQRIAPERVAITAALVLVTSGLFIAYARVAIPDMALTVAVSIAILAGFLATVAGEQTRLRYWALCFAAMGVAVLAKGLVGIALVVGILAIYFAAMREWRFIRWREALIGAVVFLIVAGTWYAPVTIKHGWEFIHEFFIRHHLQRYVSNTFGHPQPFYFFFVIAIAGVAPWAFFLIPALARLRLLKPRASKPDALLTLAWIWTAVPLAFFSFSGSKLPGYILPVFPALAIIIGTEVARFINGERGRLLKAAAWMTALLLVGIGVGFAVYLKREAISASGWQAIFYGLPLAMALVSLTALVRQQGNVFVQGAAGVMLSVIISGMILLPPKVNDEWTMKSISLEAAAALRPGERIAYFIKKEFAAVFYAEGRVVCGVGEGDIFNALREDILADALENEASLIVITTTNWRKGLESYPRFTTELLATQGEALAFRVALKR
jgi:4-amino-4-deoxy-L-arabinose transferase-like glycosyltransferase